MQKKMLHILATGSLVASLSLFVSGCSKKQIESDASVKPIEQVVVEEVIVDVGEGVGLEESIESSPVRKYGATLSEARTHAPMLPVYFDFDKSNIRQDQVGRLENNAAFMKDNMNLRVTVQGNCDERGTQEYNMALGDRRAQSSKRYLVNLGVDDRNIHTLSFGEEKPLVHGHDDYAWAQNRRDDFVVSR